MALTGNCSAAAASSFCSVRYGTLLDSYVARHILRRFPLHDQIVEVDVKQWDGVLPLPHCFRSRDDPSTSRCSPIAANFVPRNCGYPSVTVLNGCISPKEFLFYWQEQQIKLLGLAGFRAASKIRMEKSRMLHALLHSWLEELRSNGKIAKTEGQIIEDIDQQELIPIGYIESVLPLFRELTAHLRAEDRNWISAEQMVYNHRLIYRGKFDAILPYNGELLLIDWKGVTCGSSKSVDNLGADTLYADNKMQLSAYVKAVNCDTKFDNFPQLKRAGVCRIYESGAEAKLVIMDEEEIDYNYELYKGWINAFWWTLANASSTMSDKTEQDGEPEEEVLIDFRYEPPPKDGKNKKILMDSDKNV